MEPVPATTMTPVPVPNASSNATSMSPTISTSPPTRLITSSRIRPEIAGLMRELVMSLVGGEVEIVGDIDVAFEDAFGTGTGVIVVAGTGSIAYGRNAERSEERRVGEECRVRV